MGDFEKHIEPYVVDKYYVSDFFKVKMWANHSPHVGDKYLIEGKPYKVFSVIDDTDDDEYAEGLSYDQVTFELIEE